MLQHWVAFCQPTHARLAHFAPSARSQFPSQADALPCQGPGLELRVLHRVVSR